MMNFDRDDLEEFSGLDLTRFSGKQIVSIKLNKEWNEGNGAIEIEFKDNPSLVLFDYSQQCCENRYITTDDNLDDVSGDILVSIKRKSGSTVVSDYDEHEVQFLEIQTNNQQVTFTTHNEHNGYYSGFWIMCFIKEQDVK